MAVSDVEINVRYQLVLHVPLEVLYRILNYLELRDILAIRKTCKSLYTICQCSSAFEYITVDRSIHFKKLLRRSETPYFTKTRSVCWKGSPQNVDLFLEGISRSFPKLVILDLSHSPVQLKQFCKVDNLFERLKSVSLCVGVPHVFEAQGIPMSRPTKQTKVVLVNFLSQILQTNTIKFVHLLLVPDVSAITILNTRDAPDLCLDFSKLPSKVKIENFTLFQFELTNPFPLFSNSHNIEKFIIKQHNCPLSFSIPISLSSTTQHVPIPSRKRSIYLEYNTILKALSSQDTLYGEVSSFHRQYSDLNIIPDPFSHLIDYEQLSFLDLSYVSSSTATKINLDSLHNLTSLNINGQSTVLLHILDCVPNRIIFPKLTELNIGGIQCFEIFYKVPKQNLMLFISQLTKLRMLTLTPCMTLFPSNRVVENSFPTNSHQSIKFMKLETYNICVSLLFRSCPYLEHLTVTDKNLMKCQLCVDEYSNLKQTRKLLNPLPDILTIPLTHFSLYFKQVVVDNFSTQMLEEIAFHQLPNLTHFSIETNRNFLTPILCRFIQNNSNLITLRIDCSMNFTPVNFKSLKFLKYLENLFLTGYNASEVKSLENFISEQPLLSIVWLHFKGLTGVRRRELYTNLMQLKHVRAVQDGNINVSCKRGEFIPNTVLALYSRSGLN